MCLFLIHWRILKKEGKNTVSHLLVCRGEACFVAAEGNNFSASPLVHRGEARTKLSGLQQRSDLRRCIVWLRCSKGTLCLGEATRIPPSINTCGWPIFFPPPVFVQPFVSCSCLVCVFCRFLADCDYYGSQEDRPSQMTPFQLHIMGGTSPSGRSSPIHFPGGRATLPRVTLHPFIRSGEGFSYL